MDLVGASVDVDFCAGHDAAAVGGEEGHDVGGLRGVVEAVHRHGRDHARAQLLFVTSAKEWFRVAPNSETIEYAEHFFHKVRDGRFYEMNYLIDVEAVQRQLGM
ncbi:hypothetical protein ACWEQ2_35655 [Streptomyces sp. NPDC004096]|uniref:hypothetical protein n=1 Tax=Streptomyces sp. HUAS TT11 TaxID=3447508 RepID=UPI003F656FA6